jgi:hypothetical protein
MLAVVLGAGVMPVPAHVGLRVCAGGVYCICCTPALAIVVHMVDVVGWACGALPVCDLYMA